MLIPKRKLRIMDLDIETRPLSFWIPDEPTAEITAICTAFVGEPSSMITRLLGKDDATEMLVEFVERYDSADMVTGHYLTRFDLPTINGALLEFGLPQLKPKLVCDTRTDMHKKKGMPATQEHLSDMLNLPFPKIKMSQADWREANRLTPEGLDKTLRRVSGDVVQHMALREEMNRRGLLRGPRVWRS